MWCYCDCNKGSKWFKNCLYYLKTNHSKNCIEKYKSLENILSEDDNKIINMTKLNKYKILNNDINVKKKIISNYYQQNMIKMILINI